MSLVSSLTEYHWDYVHYASATVWWGGIMFLGHPCVRLSVRYTLERHKFENCWGITMKPCIIGHGKGGPKF